MKRGVKSKDVFAADALDLVRKGQEQYFLKEEENETGAEASVNNLTLAVSYWGDQ